MAIRHNDGVENSLAAVIQEEINRSRRITFARFMELVLYHPEFGYYRRKTAEVFGLHGDFYTAGQLQPTFGELVSSFAAQLHDAGIADRSFEVLDLGAGRQDLRAALHPWNYRAVDWDTEALPQSVSGLIIANEFFDALPVHILRKRKAGWREVMVKAENRKLVFAEADDVSPTLLEYTRLYGAIIPAGGLIEISLAAGEWIAKLSNLLASGDLLIIDYGYEARELVRFPEGTLLGYQRHSTTGDLLSNPGTRDITAHVNFSYLRDRALDAGLEIVSESPLGKWALGVWDECELAARWKKADERWRLQWKQLVFGMGSTFRVLHLRKRTVAEKLPPNKNASVAGGVKDS